MVANEKKEECTMSLFHPGATVAAIDRQFGYHKLIFGGLASTETAPRIRSTW